MPSGIRPLSVMIVPLWKTWMSAVIFRAGITPHVYSPRVSNGSGSTRRPAGLRLLREVRVGLHFVDLGDVPLAMRRDEQHDLIRVDRLQRRMLNEMVAQIVLRGLDIGDVAVAALLEM